MTEPTGVCVVCEQPAKSRCSACRIVFYCSKKHQTEDWRKHKIVCRSYEVKPASGQRNFVVATRSIKKGKVIIDETPLVVGPNYINDGENLCPGCYRLGNVESRCLRCGWPVCSTKCPGHSDPTRHGAECALLSKIKCVLIGHSCYVILPLRCLLLQKSDPKKWKTILKMAIPAVAVVSSGGENISTLFMDTWMSTWARQVSLASRRLIHCRCARCLDPRELGTDFGTLKCTKGSCTGWVIPVNTLRIDFTEWKCGTCNKVYSSRDVMTLLISLKDEMEGCRVGEDQDVEKYEKLLARLQIFLHPNHHYCLLMKERLSNYHGRPLVDGSSGEAALMSDARLKRTAELCQDVLRIMTNPAIVVQDTDKIAQCLMILSLANAEIAKRKKATGEWSPAQANRVLAECQDMVSRAVRMKHSQFDISSADERAPVELIEKMSLYMWSMQAGV